MVRRIAVVIAMASLLMTGCSENAEEVVAAKMYYIVRSGDTLASIANAHGLDEVELLQFNQRESAWKIKPGDRVRVRRYPPTFLLSSEPQANEYSDMLWNFRKTFNRMRKDKEIGKCLNDLWTLREAEHKVWREKRIKNGENLYLDSFHDEQKKSNEIGLVRCLGRTDVLKPFLDALPHLKLAEGAILDCFLYGDEWGAQGEFKIRQGNDVKPLQVLPDGTDASAWECVLLHRASQQFFLGWHAAYNACRIVTDVRRFEEEVDLPFAGDQAWAKIGEPGRQRMQRNDFGPKVIMMDGYARVTYYVFSSFGGLMRITEEVDMMTGAVPRAKGVNTIVEYECGVWY